MIRVPPQIRRPGVLGALASLTAAMGVAACVSLFGLASALDAAPVEIQAGAEQLEATLAKADWRAPGRGPVVYLATAQDCQTCTAYTARAVEELRRDGYEVWILALKPGGNGPRHRVLRAVVAENGADMRLPALFWRRGARWRAAFGAEVDARQRVLADPET
ncbi:MAG TPA: hypothetical protein VG841_13775 [Caulobacterales bacterium]|nr:hypothetical protein [Caulobacterales bacterium]